MLHSTKGTPAVKPAGVIQTCEHCKRVKNFLLYSSYCANCENPAKGRFYRGWVLWSPDHDWLMDEGQRVMDYVWYTSDDAHAYNRARGEPKPEISLRSVLSTHPFNWKYGSGYANGLMMAAQLVTLHRDHRFAPAPYEAFLAPISAKIGWSEVVTL